MSALDISRLNLSEKDIEEWIYQNPEGFGQQILGCGPIRQWIGRQYTLPSGIADLIGVGRSGRAIVIEVKNVPINKAALTQVIRYEHDVGQILSNYAAYHNQGGKAVVITCLVGTDIDQQTLIEADALGIHIYLFQPILNLELWSPGHVYTSDYWEEASNIAERPEWRIFGPTYEETGYTDVPGHGCQVLDDFIAKRQKETDEWQRGE